MEVDSTLWSNKALDSPKQKGATLGHKYLLDLIQGVNGRGLNVSKYPIAQAIEGR